MPTPEEQKQTVAGIFDRASATYDQTGADYFTPFGRLLVAAGALQPGERVLDIGSGRGAVLLPAADAVGPTGQVDGIDIAAGMVARLSADLERLGIANASVTVGDAERLAVVGPYDAVLSGLVLFFLPDPLAALREFARLLRPGGRLAFSSFSQDDERWRSVFTTIGAFLAPGDSLPNRPLARAGPFSNDQSLGDLVSAGGFVDVVHRHHTHATFFASMDDWWNWSWSQGMRAQMERIPTDRLDEARVAVYQAINDIRDPDGRISVRVSIRVTTAHTPQ